jgi:hypothetical protein
MSKWNEISPDLESNSAKFLYNLLFRILKRKGWIEFGNFEVSYKTSYPYSPVFIRCEKEYEEFITQIRNAIADCFVQQEGTENIFKIKNPAQLRRKLQTVIPIHPLKEELEK